MSIQVGLTHLTHYRFDRRVKLSPHEIRLRPAPHARTPVLSYSLRIEPAEHFINWQQDPYGNWLARVVFPQPADELKICVDLLADLSVVNPFDFFLESYAERWPFAYEADLRKELGPFLEVEAQGPLFSGPWLAQARALLEQTGATIHALVALNQALYAKVRYLVRLEPGVQTPEQTLELGSGSCRDSAWLLVQTLRQLGLAARFASGYLIQLVADQKPLDGPAGPVQDFTDLHAWAEVYLPGAGWVGLDPTSGLLTGEGHIPLACTAAPKSAAAVIGYTDPCSSELEFRMSVTRMRQTPRVTAPVSDAQWQQVQKLAQKVEARLESGKVGLTMGGEPTFVAIDDADAPEWNTSADSPRKYALASQLLERLQQRFSSGALRHHGQGKWYPGEPLPRWALSCLWRSDGLPLWRDPRWLATTEGEQPPVTLQQVRRYAQQLVKELGLPQAALIPAHEDPLPALFAEATTPVNIDPCQASLEDPASRRQLAQQLCGGLRQPVGFVLPLKASERTDPGAPTRWRSSRWPLRRGHLFLLSGDSPMGFRLPLGQLPWRLPAEIDPEFTTDSFAEREPLADPPPASGKGDGGAATPDPREVIHTALCLQLRDGKLHVFLPPVALLEDFTVLIRAIEDAARQCAIPLLLEGYLPEHDARLQRFAITPDPGVIEVNIHPSGSWQELHNRTLALYEEARQCGLTAEKFMLDGRHSGTGGGNHITLGGATPAQSPLLRRPQLLRSLLLYWQHHPSLSYLFSGLFIGPTSQAPRVDEARDDTLYELGIALEQLDAALQRQAAHEGAEPDDTLALEPWLVDRCLRNLLVDLTGNTHRAEFCIDKLYPPAGPRLGLLEFRGFEMPPHPRMALLQALLLRALVARCWHQPYGDQPIHWGNQLHDRFLLPHWVDQDFGEVLTDLRQHGFDFARDWFAAFFEFRFPLCGSVQLGDATLQLRQAIEPWHVLGEEMSAQGTARYVDSSVERVQVQVQGLRPDRQRLLCNGREVPLQATAVAGQYVAGVRFRAWAPPSALHPGIAVQAPLVFDLVDLPSARALGGCTWHVSHPGGRNFESAPVNALEAQARRRARFFAHGHSPGPLHARREAPNPLFPCTLDLRRAPRWLGDEHPPAATAQ